MRKKIFIILICFISLLPIVSVNAKDHTLFYSVDSLNVDSTSNKISFDGWAFIHNYNQCGGESCSNKVYYEVDSRGVPVTSIVKGKSNVNSNYTYTAYTDVYGGGTYKSKIIINIRKSASKNSPIVYSTSCEAAGCSSDGISLSYKPIDLFSWMCQEVGSDCQGYVTDNVGFHVDIDFSNFEKNQKYYFFIEVKFVNSNIHNEVHLGISDVVATVPSNTVTNNDGSKATYKEIILSNGSKLKIGNLAKTVTNRNNNSLGRQYYYDSNNNWFYRKTKTFESNKDYTIEEGTKNYNIGGDYVKSHSYYPVLYKFDMGAWGPSVWFESSVNTPFYIEPPEDDHICNISTGNIDACTGGSVQNSCSKMTVYANVEGQDISAVVSLSESSSITPGDDSDGFDNKYNSYFGMDYSKYYIVRGKTFHYALTYKNTASWKFLEKNYGTIVEKTGDNAIREKMKDYYTEIGSNFAAKVSINSNDRENFNTAGYWDCDGGFNNGTKNGFANNYNNNNETFSTTLTCKYVLKYLELNGNGKDTYGEKKSINGTELTLGNNFYIPLDYKNNKFNWEVTGSDLSTVKVRIITNNKTATDSLIKTSINSDSNKCYVNVVGPNNTPDTSGDPGYYPGIEYEDDKLYVYRSVSVSNPFPDDNIPENWNDANLINRLKNSYQNMTNPDYETVPLNASIVRQIKNLNTVYTDWDDTGTSSSDNSGNNTFVKESGYFKPSNGKHCKYGLYDPVCDRRG